MPVVFLYCYILGCVVKAGHTISSDGDSVGPLTSVLTGLSPVYNTMNTTFDFITLIRTPDNIGCIRHYMKFYHVQTIP